MLKIAALQMNSGGDVRKNLVSADILIRQAVLAGATFVATPENTPYMGTLENKVALAEGASGPIGKFFSALAAELKIHLLLGSFCEKAGIPGKCRNTALLFGPDGGLRSKYSKINLFDVDIQGKVRNRESDTVAAGREVKVCWTSFGAVGMAICFDLRFPAHFQALRKKGAELICVPSAFTSHTGRDHWEALLRARAIETQTYVIAPSQVGLHGDEGLPESHGHAMIIDPWGCVLAERLDPTPGFVMAEIDLRYQEKVRKEMPIFQ